MTVVGVGVERSLSSGDCVCVKTFFPRSIGHVGEDDVTLTSRTRVHCGRRHSTRCCVSLRCFRERSAAAFSGPPAWPHPVSRYYSTSNSPFREEGVIAFIQICICWCWQMIVCINIFNIINNKLWDPIWNDMIGWDN